MFTFIQFNFLQAIDDIDKDMTVDPNMMIDPNASQNISGTNKIPMLYAIL